MEATTVLCRIPTVNDIMQVRFISKMWQPMLDWERKVYHTALFSQVDHHVWQWLSGWNRKLIIQKQKTSQCICCQAIVSCLMLNAKYCRVKVEDWVNAFSTTCTVPIENCENWWLSSCHSSVAEHWQVSWVQFLVATSLLNFRYFCLISWVVR